MKGATRGGVEGGRGKDVGLVLLGTFRIVLKITTVLNYANTKTAKS